MHIQKNARLMLIIVAVVLVLIMGFVMSNETRPIQKNVSYNSTIFQEQKLYKGTLNECDETCVNTPFLRTKTIKQITFKDVVNISKDKMTLDIIDRYNYKLCYVDGTCEQYANILDIDKTKYTKKIPVGIEIKYRKEPDGFETKKRWEWLLNEVIDE